MRRGTQSGTRFSGRREVAIGLGVYALYLLASRRKRDERGRARAAANAERVVALERRLGIHVEPRLQASLLPHRRLLAVLNVAYVFSNAALTVGWLMRLYGKQHPEFHRFRRAAVSDHPHRPADLRPLPVRAAPLARGLRRHDVRRDRG